MSADAGRATSLGALGLYIRKIHEESAAGPFSRRGPKYRILVIIIIIMPLGVCVCGTSINQGSSDGWPQ